MPEIVGNKNDGNKNIGWIKLFVFRELIRIAIIILKQLRIRITGHVSVFREQDSN